MNDDRYVFGAVNTECEPTLHTVPFGNWGVISNVADLWDGDQFRGWKEVESGSQKREWNSCTDDFPPRHFLYYNADINSTQRSYEGPREYGVVESWLLNYDPCSWGGWDDVVITSTNNYMFIKELDPIGTDQLVAIGQWPDVSVVMDCPLGSEYCAAQTPWVSPVGINPNVLSANISMFVEIETTRR